jgi:hypothetical protein
MPDKYFKNRINQEKLKLLGFLLNKSQSESSIKNKGGFKENSYLKPTSMNYSGFSDKLFTLVDGRSVDSSSRRIYSYLLKVSLSKL